MVNSQYESIRNSVIADRERLIKLTDKDLLDEIQKQVFSHDSKDINFSDKERFSYDIYNSFRGYDVIQRLLDDKSISEIMINSYDDIYVEKHGVIEKSDVKFKDNDRLLTIINRMLSNVGKKINKSNPIVDARLLDGSRINVILDPISLRGPTVTIRKFVLNNTSISDLIKLETIAQELGEIIEEMVDLKLNIFICGGTSSGKTTLLNAISSIIPHHERIITIEDSAELSLPYHNNCISLETKSGVNKETSNSIDMSRLIKASLRMRPDRIIVGEVRGREALDMLQAMNTGHDGSISTGHSNSNEDMLYRLETMIMEGSDLPLNSIRRQIFSGLDILINIKKIGGGKRRISEISYLNELRDGTIKLANIYNIQDGLIMSRLDIRNISKKVIES